MENSLSTAISRATALTHHYLLLSKILSARSFRTLFQRDPRHARMRFATGYFAPKLASASVWSKLRTEDSNFLYSISQLNRLQIMQGLAVMFAVDLKRVEQYFCEFEQDNWIHSHLKKQLDLDGLHDSVPNFGRRIAWYAIARLLRPTTVVETGVEKGIGSMVLLRALEKNWEESKIPFQFIGTDIDPSAGRYIPPELMRSASIKIGDSLSTLRKLDQEVHLFISDSDHDPEYERLEYETIGELLGESSAVVSDNAHVSPALSEFARNQGRRFLFLPEQPENHWYPGAGIGVMWGPNSALASAQ